MREHKYRAWIKSEKRMYQVSAIMFEGRVTVSLSDHLLGWKEYSISDEAELMEYTGRKDAKGAQICEGDRVHASFFGGAQIASGDGWIVWDNQKGAWRVQGHSWWCGLDEAEFEIIGNIYENEE